MSIMFQSDHTNNMQSTKQTSDTSDDANAKGYTCHDHARNAPPAWMGQNAAAHAAPNGVTPNWCDGVRPNNGRLPAGSGQARQSWQSPGQLRPRLPTSVAFVRSPTSMRPESKRGELRPTLPDIGAKSRHRAACADTCLT